MKLKNKTLTECPVCFEEIETKTLHFLENGYKSCQCPACDLEFNIPMKAATAEWYKSEYSEIELRSSLYSGRTNIWEFSESVTSMPVKKGKLLEIGCGEGHFLKLAEKSGYEAVGIDINEHAVNKAVQSGLTAYCMTADDLLDQIPNQSFDAVCFFHVLEHLENPCGFTASLNRLLKEGGHIILSVPNPGRIGLVFGRESWDYPPHHLTSWNRRSLEAMLKLNNFEIINIKDEPLSLLKVLPGYLSGRVNFSFNRNIETAHSMTRSSATKTALRLIYKSLSRCKNYISHAAAFLLLPWYFLRYRHKKGSSLLIIARKTGSNQHV